MPRIAEVFGHAVENLSQDAQDRRALRACRFRGNQCSKQQIANPLGVCSLGDGQAATAICPVRFREADRIFIDAARIAFGVGVPFVPVPEVKILRVGDKKIGKVDYLLARLDEAGEPLDFAALEVQAVYFSGTSMRPPFEFFVRECRLDPGDPGERRPDYRSSAQKRLVPQLQLKVPVFRRWGKKFFIVVDSLFFNNLPEFRRVPAGNSEVTWLVYPIEKSVGALDYSLQEPAVVYSVWDDIVTALREGEAPEPREILDGLSERVAGHARLMT